MKLKLHPLILLILVIVVSFLLMAFQIIDESRIEEIITGIVGFAIMLFGPKPLKKIFDLLKIPGGPWRVFATYVSSGVFGFVVLLIAGTFAAIEWNIETIMALAGALSVAAQMAYHRLKDLREI